MVDVRFFETCAPLTLATLLGDAAEDVLDAQTRDLVIEGACELDVALSGDIVLAANRKYIDDLRKTRAGVAIIGNALRDDVPEGTVGLVFKDPHSVYVNILATLYPESGRRLSLRNGQVGQQTFAPDVTIVPGAHISNEVEIGGGTLIGTNSCIGHGVTIGRDCIIGPNVSIECAHIGDNVVIGAGSRVGSEGFGWLDHGKSNKKVPQLGRVIIQNSVEIGANSTVDRGGSWGYFDW